MLLNSFNNSSFGFSQFQMIHPLPFISCNCNPPLIIPSPDCYMVYNTCLGNLSSAAWHSQVTLERLPRPWPMVFNIEIWVVVEITWFLWTWPQHADSAPTLEKGSWLRSGQGMISVVVSQKLPQVERGGVQSGDMFKRNHRKEGTIMGESLDMLQAGRFPALVTNHSTFTQQSHTIAQPQVHH
jgi:hypothetical protein